MSFRTHYWSCSPLANWIRGTAKGGAKTSEGWEEWRQQAKTAHPIRYWIAEEGLDKIQNAIYWPIDIFHKIRYYINNRWITRTHTLTSNLKKGQWHEFDTRLLHCMFDELVNFVEIDSAWMEVVFSSDNSKKYQVPWWRRVPFRIRGWRCPAAGVAHLEWAANLTWNEEWIDKDDPKYGKPTAQAEVAQETLELYKWWREIRPARPDPYEASGWSEFCSRRRSNIFRSPEEQEESSRILPILEKMEEDYVNEDTEMMVRLIKIRQGLWT